MKYLRMHLNFFLSPINGWVLFISLFMAILGMIYASDLFQGYAYMDAYRKTLSLSFMNESMLVFEFVFVFISIYTGMNLASRQNQAMMVYTVASDKMKQQFIISRVLIGPLIFFVLLIIITLTILSFIISFTPYAYDVINLITHFFYLFIQMIQYYMITLCMMMIFNHFLMGLISFLIFWVMEVFAHDKLIPVIGQLQSIIINPNIYPSNQKNITIYVILYFFLCFSYIIVMRKKIVY